MGNVSVHKCDLSTYPINELDLGHIEILDSKSQYCQLRARRALLQFKDVPIEKQKDTMLYKAIAPFWFSTEHLLSAITPF